MNDWLDYYEILGVSFGATQEEIKSGFREMAKKYHPDKHTGEDIEYYEQKTKFINEAYDVLKNEEKRKEYDKDYLNHKNNVSDSSENFQEDVNFDDVKKHYKEEEIYFTEMMALKQVIKEELDKSSVILDYKVNLLNSIKNSDIDEDDYIYLIDEFIEVVNSYFEQLDNLKLKAKKYSLDGEIEKIDNTITYINEEIGKIPSTLKEAQLFFNEEDLKEKSLKKLVYLKNNYQIIIDKIDSITKYVAEGKVNKFTYKHIVDGINIEIESFKLELQDLAKVFKALELEKEYDEALYLLSNLNMKKANSIPDDFESAKILGKFESSKNDIQNFFAEDKAFRLKLEKIYNILKNHNYSKRYENLYNYAKNIINNRMQILDNIHTNLTSLKRTSIDNYCKDNVTFNEFKRSFEMANEINITADKLFAKLTNYIDDDEQVDDLSDNDKNSLKYSILKKQKAYLEKSNVIDMVVNTKILCDVLDKVKMTSIDSYCSSLMQLLLTEYYQYDSLSRGYSVELNKKKAKMEKEVEALENELEKAIYEMELTSKEKAMFMLALGDSFFALSWIGFLAWAIASEQLTAGIACVSSLLGTIITSSLELMITNSYCDDKHIESKKDMLKTILNTFKKYYNKRLISDEKREYFESDIRVKRKKLDHYKSILN